MLRISVTSTEKFFSISSVSFNILGFLTCIDPETLATIILLFEALLFLIMKLIHAYYLKTQKISKNYKSENIGLSSYHLESTIVF